MNSPSSSLVRFAVAALACVLPGDGLCAQDRAAIVETVELFVPVRPRTLEVAGKAQIVYELHITNLLPVHVAITRIQVKTASQVPIADYRDGELTSRIGRPGLPRDLADPHLIGPGMRAVAYFWIAVPEGSATPRALVHRVEVDILRKTGPVHAAAEGALSIVSRESAVVLDPPLRGGPWVAIYDPLLRGGHRTAIYTLDGRARVPARFAIDWIRLRAGSSIDAGTPRPADWNGYGAEVLAVGSGVVAAAMDDISENVEAPDGAALPIPLQNASGNYVALDLGHGRFAFYEHLKHGSIAVKAGDRVQSGQVLGRLGHSGSSSMGPHLHFHVSDARSPLAAEGLPFVFARFDHLGAFSSIEALTSGEKWLANPEGPESVRTGEMPSANSVVRFR